MSDRDAQEARKRADEARVAQAGERWRARSRRVKLYRRILPIVILTLAGGALTWTVFRTVMSGVERKASESREIRLDNPMFHGQDAQGRSFVVGAKGAIRDPATGHFRLVGPLLKLNLGGRKVTELTADGGTYIETSRKVVIGPNVKISDGGSGFVLTTPEAVVDTNTGVVTGDKGVQGQGPLGTINASSYAIYDQGQRVVFSGQGDNKMSGTINPAGSGR
ncbi:MULTISPECIES: LPS export ABC transporter periplasmic protein LptC [unclassified Brevundimonas]|uniref:LPS export ABC transporter periplasmic protein LptC n=1 Tax=unclassified Brevundimonas TaxID=2622653 RepID=UPI000CFCFD2D|nr:MULTISPECIES: LPS export ABC transporter periplasmic protein LptC [unclassified Brevundimonas]PRA31679.1 LPS export ABC transporter periplasmic protein LptC [Brevundimonas sp. MYb27]PQZ83552.1 LPS export ABC transporter periplasmic protein LptC [Brevundimonas sp. MYb31]PRB15859.1 LPS export ABC transporter periplasmic protein LptC [Brevundimonas sp. MYb52]PRB36355.1 LPS export ABC transporter periplasmic protein LptC [Brevundimonas sp. MYb46]PRB45548.1 LPS export ABC transporter periplasmic